MRPRMLAAERLMSRFSESCSKTASPATRSFIGGSSHLAFVISCRIALRHLGRKMATPVHRLRTCLPT